MGTVFQIPWTWLHGDAFQWPQPGIATLRSLGFSTAAMALTDNSISIELHIVVENGVNLPAVCRSIMNEVRYVVTKNTGVQVRAVDVCVDSMIL